MSKTADEERKRLAREEATRRSRAVLRELLQLVDMRSSGATQADAARALQLSERSVKYREETVRELLSRKGLRRTRTE